MNQNILHLATKIKDLNINAHIKKEWNIFKYIYWIKKMIKKENASKCGKFTTTTTENLAYPGFWQTRRNKSRTRYCKTRDNLMILS